VAVPAVVKLKVPGRMESAVREIEPAQGLAVRPAENQHWSLFTKKSGCATLPGHWWRFSGAGFELSPSLHLPFRDARTVLQLIIRVISDCQCSLSVRDRPGAAAGL
jgi:hypothetical protein